MKNESVKHTDDSTNLLSRLKGENYCYLTTIGRVSGKPHEIEIWFGIQNSTLYLLSGDGEKSDWVRNLLRNSSVIVRIAEHTFNGTARIVSEKEEELMARKMLDAKYQGWREGRRFSHWARTALVVGIDLTPLKNK